MEKHGSSYRRFFVLVLGVLHSGFCFAPSRWLAWLIVRGPGPLCTRLAPRCPSLFTPTSSAVSLVALVLTCNVKCSLSSNASWLAKSPNLMSGLYVRMDTYTEDSRKFFDTLQCNLRTLASSYWMLTYAWKTWYIWLAYYAQHERIFRIGRTVDRVALRPKRGIPQGCLALFASNLLIRRWCTNEAVGAKPCAFVDDRDVEAPDCLALQAAVDASPSLCLL